MSAPQIPNLLLRGSGSSNRGRSRGGGLRGLGGPRGPPPGPSAPPTQALSSREAIDRAQRAPASAKDKAVRLTDWDATLMRRSAVDAGYLGDPYINTFTAGRPPERRFPIINRGTYVRTIAIDILLENWLRDASPGKPKQVISLGAGSDTRYWRLMEKGLAEHLCYHEFDFPEVGRQKHAVINGSSSLSPRNSVFYGMQVYENEFGWMVQEPDTQKLHRGYAFHGVDLRDLADSSKTFEFKALRWDMPTLILSECCLCYLEPSVAQGVVDFFLRGNPCAGILIYEPINPESGFGETMISNLAHRGILMPSLYKFKTLRDQLDRLSQLKMLETRVADINTIWEKWIPRAEQARVSQLEMFDELEEWRLLGAHYMVAWGWRDLGRDVFGGFHMWEDLPVQASGRDNTAA